MCDFNFKKAIHITNRYAAKTDTDSDELSIFVQFTLSVTTEVFNAHYGVIITMQYVTIYHIRGKIKYT